MPRDGGSRCGGRARSAAGGATTGRGGRSTPIGVPPAGTRGRDFRAALRTRRRPLPVRDEVAGNQRSAICTPLVAAPLRRLSATIHSARPFVRESSRRIRPTNTSSLPEASSGSGVAIVGRVVDHAHTRRRGQQLARVVGATAARRVSIQTASEWPRHTGTRTRWPRSPRSGSAQDLARLLHQLGLFRGVAVGVEHVAVGQRVERDLVRVDVASRRARRPAPRGSGRASSSIALVPVPLTRPGRSATVTCVEAGRVEQRLQHRHELDGGAVGVREDAAVRRRPPRGSPPAPPAARRDPSGTRSTCRSPRSRARPLRARTSATCCRPPRTARGRSPRARRR